MSSLLIIGAGGHGRSVLDLVLSLGNYDKIAFATNEDHDCPILGYSLLDERALSPEFVHKQFDAVVVAIGDNRARLDKVCTLSKAGVILPPLVHPRAYVSPLASLGEGSIVLAGAVVNAFANIGLACIVNTHAVVEHECRISDGVHLSPGVVVAGGSSIGEGAWLCANSGVADHVSLPAWSTLAGGSFLNSTVLKGGLYAGQPAILRRPL